MPINVLEAMLGPQSIQSARANIAGKSTDWQKSKYLLKYMYKTEGRDGNEVEIQLPGIIGLENVRLQKEYNNGSDVAEQIKRQNELTQKYLDLAKEHLKEDGDAIDVDVDNCNGMVFARIFIPDDKEENSLEKSANNFYHTEAKFTVRKKKVA